MERRWLWLVGLLACADDDANVSGMDASWMDASAIDAGSHLDAVVASDADASDANVCGVRLEQLPVASANHVPGEIDYPDPPPVGGDHNECWAKWGVYEDELADERWVHNLEHGGVVFLYHCPDGCQNEVDTMTTFVRGRTQALLTPYAALPTRYAVVAWGVRLLTNCFDMPKFRQFYTDRVDDAPESLPDDPPRPCN
jgi:hypothetical protein